MKILEVGSFEAKNKLSDLLSKVEKGQRVFITRRGKRVAILMSPDSIDPAGSAHNGPSLMEEIREFRATARRGPEPLKQLIEEGRR